MFSGFPAGSEGKESTRNVGDPGLIPGSGRSPGGGPGYPLQYFGLKNPMDRGAWRAAAHGVAKGRTLRCRVDTNRTSQSAYSPAQRNSESEWGRSVLSDSATPWTVQAMGCSRPGCWRGSCSLLQGIFPTQGSNPGLLHCRRMLYQLGHKGSPQMDNNSNERGLLSWGLEGRGNPAPKEGG